MKILVVEDGYEYIDTLRQFVGDDFVWERAGSGPQALDRLASEHWDALLLDMRFDRSPPDELLGDLSAVSDRFNGDPAQARLFLETHQGNFILAAIREAGHRVPVLLSYDFGTEPRRWRRLESRFRPVAYLSDNAGPTDIAGCLASLSAGDSVVP